MKDSIKIDATKRITMETTRLIHNSQKSIDQYHLFKLSFNLLLLLYLHY